MRIEPDGIVLSRGLSIFFRDMERDDVVEQGYGHGS